MCNVIKACFDQVYVNNYLVIDIANINMQILTICIITLTFDKIC